MTSDPYVKYELEKEFANEVATKQVFIPKAGHINSESVLIHLKI